MAAQTGGGRALLSHLQREKKKKLSLAVFTRNNQSKMQIQNHRKEVCIIRIWIWLIDKLNRLRPLVH